MLSTLVYFARIANTYLFQHHDIDSAYWDLYETKESTEVRLNKLCDEQNVGCINMTNQAEQINV